MRISGNNVLITGGAIGIGMALAEIFLRNGNEVVICSRRENKLIEAKNKFPQLQTFKCDVADQENRKHLY